MTLILAVTDAMHVLVISVDVRDDNGTSGELTQLVIVTALIENVNGVLSWV
jgi:hypothetical protein